MDIKIDTKIFDELFETDKTILLPTNPTSEIDIIRSSFGIFERAGILFKDEKEIIFDNLLLSKYKQSPIVYLLVDVETGIILKIGKSSDYINRMNKYATCGNDGSEIVYNYLMSKHTGYSLDIYTWFIPQKDVHITIPISNEVMVADLSLHEYLERYTFDKYKTLFNKVPELGKSSPKVKYSIR